MNLEGAFIYALTQYLSADAELLEDGNGVFYNQADATLPAPFTVWKWHYDKRELTLGNEASRSVYFQVKAAFGDANGANFTNGNALLERFVYLLDGVETADSIRIKAALTAWLSPNGYKCTLCRQQTFLPPHEEYLGEDKTNYRTLMGYVFRAEITKA